MKRVFDRRSFLIVSCLFACRQRANLPELGAVPPFALTDQAGKPFTRETLAGKTWVAAFMFTRCPTVCPRITQRMKELQGRAREQGIPIRLVSFSVDPEHDTPAVLSTYAARQGVDLSTWTFATGDHATISRTAVEGFKMALEGRYDASAPEGGILHGSHLVLVDGSAVIRGFYRTDDPAEMARLLTDAKGLG